MEEYTDLKIEVYEDLVLLKLLQDNGGRNLLKCAVLKEISDALVMITALYNPKIIVLSGGGKVFSLGADLDEVHALEETTALEYSKLGQALTLQIQKLDAVTIAAVNGMALGGGMELVLACDVRWAHSRAVFAFPECLHGLISAWGGTQLARCRIPASLAAELLMTGKYIGAEIAYNTGIISRIFTGKDFHGQVVSAAGEFLKTDRRILSQLKHLLNSPGAYEPGLAAESHAFSGIIKAHREKST